jgi:hypothetical protein
MGEKHYMAHNVLTHQIVTQTARLIIQKIPWVTILRGVYCCMRRVSYTT